MNRFHRWYCRSERWKRKLRETILPWALGDADLGDDILELGPGPGLTTDLLRGRAPHVTSIEIDARLAASLAIRLRGTNVQVLQCDATALPLRDASFSGAVALTMLHHVRSAELQNHLLTEVRRVLRPGAVFVGSDSASSLIFRMAHLFDTMVVIDPRTFSARLRDAGFEEVTVERGNGRFRFAARVPAAAPASP